jgi:hypothetical protein
MSTSKEYRSWTSGLDPESISTSDQYATLHWKSWMRFTNLQSHFQFYGWGWKNVSNENLSSAYIKALTPPVLNTLHCNPNWNSNHNRWWALPWWILEVESAMSLWKLEHKKMQQSHIFNQLHWRSMILLNAHSDLALVAFGCMALISIRI